MGYEAEFTPGRSLRTERSEQAEALLITGRRGPIGETGLRPSIGMLAHFRCGRPLGCRSAFIISAIRPR